MNLFEFDLHMSGGTPGELCGVDEAGRGPLAGPVCAAAVILPPGIELAGVNDSKKLTEKARKELFARIVQSALCSVAWASPEEIDALNILQASLLAMRRAVEGLPRCPGLVLVDGNQDPGLSLPTKTIIKGDGLSASVAAASIVAKVSRDLFMTQLAGKHPGYGFERHKGYPTALHYRRLDELGPCPAHRESFLKKWREAASHV